MVVTGIDRTTKAAKARRGDARTAEMGRRVSVVKVTSGEGMPQAETPSISGRNTVKEWEGRGRSEVKIGIGEFLQLWTV
jgi:hypothetical protein